MVEVWPLLLSWKVPIQKCLYLFLGYHGLVSFLNGSVKLGQEFKHHHHSSFPILLWSATWIPSLHAIWSFQMPSIILRSKMFPFYLLQVFKGLSLCLRPHTNLHIGTPLYWHGKWPLHNIKCSQIAGYPPQYKFYRVKFVLVKAVMSMCVQFF